MTPCEFGPLFLVSVISLQINHEPWQQLPILKFDKGLNFCLSPLTLKGSLRPLFIAVDCFLVAIQQSRGAMYKMPTRQQCLPLCPSLNSFSHPYYVCVCCCWEGIMCRLTGLHERSLQKRRVFLVPKDYVQSCFQFAIGR